MFKVQATPMKPQTALYYQSAQLQYINPHTDYTRGLQWPWFLLNIVMNLSQKTATAMSSGAWLCWIFYLFIFFFLQLKLQCEARVLKRQQQADLFTRSVA